ncbi:NADH:ubiquinone reductase (Na(+)-transporting) subunit F [Solimonas soli]|uniref:NADH:ubiquinone reductase (Na(+)-transporting) subunit F n=1 Tax=Solimonas soli TaxID=413479 RepID=UPI0004847BCF|nr:phenol 2-monooxygenase domain-containing protein [Solimonas soli]
MSYQITIEPLGQTVEASEGQSLLDACLRAGVWLPHACGHGLCGTCKVQVVDGEVDLGQVSSFALMDFEREERKCLACCAQALSDVVIEAEVDEDPDARHIPIADFSGVVRRIVDLTPTIKGIHLALDGDGMAFQAGQYVNVHIPGESRPRAFSLAQSPHDRNEIELNVRRVPGGKGTAFLHEQLRCGEPLRITGPYGRFFVRKSDPRSLLFMAGGSGLSSPKSMILDLLEEGDTRPITLIYGARNRAELYYDSLFRELAAKHAQFEYLPALSEPTENCGWDGFRGFVHEAAAQRFANDFRGQRAYLCGPPPMIEACIRTLMQGRLFERDIFTEKFLTSADAGATARSPLFKAL